MTAAAGATRAACTMHARVHCALCTVQVGRRSFHHQSVVNASHHPPFTHTYVHTYTILQIHLHPPFALAPRFRKSTKEGGLDPTWCRYYGVGGSEDDDGARLGIGTGFVLEGGQDGDEAGAKKSRSSLTTPAASWRRGTRFEFKEASPSPSACRAAGRTVDGRCGGGGAELKT